MKNFTIIVLASVLSHQALAAGAQAFTTLKDLQASSWYRLTCSDVSPQDLQTHVALEVKDGQLDGLKLVFLEPAFSMALIQYSAEDVKGLSVRFKKSELEISGERPGSYYNEDFSLKVREGKEGFFHGVVEYDDWDGGYVKRPVKCRAITYVLMPSK